MRPELESIYLAWRCSTRTSGAILIAISGYAQPRDHLATAEAGFDAHLAKPVELADIYRIVESKLRRGNDDAMGR